MLKGVEVVVVAEAWEVGQGTVVGNHRAAVGEVVGLGVDLVIASRMGNVLAGRINCTYELNISITTAEKDMKKTLEVLGVIFGVLSVVSFVQRSLDIGTWHLFNEIIQYYRAAAYLVFDFPARIFGLHFPSGLKDLWTLSFVGASAYAGTPNIEGSRFFRRYPNLTSRKYWRGLVIICGGFSGLGIFVLVSAVSPMTLRMNFTKSRWF